MALNVLELVKRFGPLLSFGDRLSGDLSDADLSTVANALSGDASSALLPLLRQLRDKEPSVAIVDILSSPTAQDIFTKFKADVDETNSSVFIKCPNCSSRFETELS